MNSLIALNGVEMHTLDKLIRQVELLFPKGLEMPRLELATDPSLGRSEYLAEETVRGITLVAGSTTALRQAVFRVARRSQVGLEPFPLPQAPVDQLQVRGVVEGFYGALWSQEQRKAVLKTVARFGGTHYLYGPKADKTLRENWRTPFTKDQLDRLLLGAHDASLLGLVYGFAISPGLDVVYDDPKEQEVLVEKLFPLIQAGYHTIGIFLDDLDPNRDDAFNRNHFDNLAHAQAYFIGGVTVLLRNRGWEGQLFVCPTKYHGSVRGNQYASHFGAHVEGDILRMWTGPAICSSHLGIRHTQAVSQVLQGPVVFWDNYPVNDASMVDQAHLGPLENRSPYLGRYCLGALYNPAVQAHSGRFALGTCLNYAHGPHGYTPEESWEWAVRLEEGPEWIHPLRILRQLSAKTPWQKEVSPLMKGHAEGIAQSGLKSPSSTLWHLEAFRQDAHDVTRFFKSLPDHPVTKDLAPWLKRLALFEDAAHMLLDAFAANRFAQNIEPIMAQLIQASKSPSDTCGDYLRKSSWELLHQMTELP